eukprot:CAMPEP_0115148832 /NCGR_PEP_ID=MMETSP0227-20121206/64105_1 /TAXON_ID=89957 /ORGANISM="Polarella glacialis, Strain CCMP 1383" /LENGTH=69 /DNA_ID=CAMNT_0002558935 /DNA_START=168 /DNA_END=377 /DNA_ORIENTATION=+
MIIASITQNTSTSERRMPPLPLPKNIRLMDRSPLPETTVASPRKAAHGAGSSCTFSTTRQGVDPFGTSH